MSVVEFKITELHRKLAYQVARGKTVTESAKAVGMSRENASKLINGALAATVESYEQEMDDGADKDYAIKTAWDKFRTATSESVQHKYFVTFCQLAGYLDKDVNINLPESVAGLRQHLQDTYGIDPDKIAVGDSGSPKA